MDDDEALLAELRRVAALANPSPKVEPKPTLVWQCTRCALKLTGNPRFCWGCGYTVYRPTWEQPGGER
jgi:hypothetical protein